MEAGGTDRPPRGRDEPSRPAAAADVRAGQDRAVAEHAAIAKSLRSLRSWLIALGLLTAIAAGIAVFALLEARDAKEAQDSTANATQADIQRVRNQLRERIDRLEARLEDAPTNERVDRLQSRIANAQRRAGSASDDASAAAERIERVATRLGDLERRIEALEAQGNGGGAQAGDN